MIIDAACGHSATPQPAKAPVYPFTLWGTLPPPLQEFRFAAPRRWRFDYAWLSAKVALEVEGGIWTGGRHTRGKGYLKDIEKYSEAAILGWCVLRVTPKDLLSTGSVLVARALIMRNYLAQDAEGLETMRTLAAGNASLQSNEHGARLIASIREKLTGYGHQKTLKKLRSILALPTLEIK